MADETGISWADSTFNPWIGCEKVSPACAHCYAETLVTGRMGRPGTWGADGIRARTSEGLWRGPLRWERDAEQFAADHKGRRRRVFCASLADVFEPRPELEPWRVDLFSLIEETPSLDWLLLTKRPDVARDWLHERHWNAPILPSKPPVPHNVWIGPSVENARWTWRADALREIPAVVRFISCEPLLGSLFELPAFRLGKPRVEIIGGAQDGLELPVVDADLRVAGDRAPLNLDGIDWVIGGGESGGRASRPTQAQWAYELRDAALEHGAAFHWKQWGSHDENGVYRGPSPKAGGKLLEGVDWCEFPILETPSRRVSDEPTPTEGD